jgi:hypothetical protein
MTSAAASTCCRTRARLLSSTTGWRTVGKPARATPNPVGEDEADAVDEGSDESALRGESDSDLDDEDDSVFADDADDRDPDLLD